MATFAEALFALPAERLRAIVQARKVDTKKLAAIAGKRQLAQFLAGELSRPGSIAEAIPQCNARALRLLQLLVSQEGDAVTSWAQVLEMAGGSELSEALSAVVYELEGLGMAIRMPGGVFVPPQVRQYVPTSLSDRFSLSRCLSSYDAPALQRICDSLGLERSTKAANMEAIRALLLEDDAAVRLKRPLDEQEMEVLEYLVQMGGSATAIEVASAVADGRTEDFFRYDWQNRWKQGRERNAVDRLLARGLIYVVSLSYGYNLFLVIPGDLLRVLTGATDTSFWTSPLPAPTPLPEPPPVITGQNSLLRDVVTLLASITIQDVVRTNTGHIHKSHLKNLARLLSRPEERYAAFLYALCRETQLIDVQGEKQTYALTGRGASWLQWDSVAQTRALLEAWRDGITWGEMYTDPLGKSSSWRPKEVMAAMRESVLGLVREYPGSMFFDIGSLTDALTFRSPLMLASNAMMGPELVPSPATFVRLLIAECLAWLGLVELGWTQPPPLPGSAAPAKAVKVGRTAVSLRGEQVVKPPAPEAVAYRLTPLGAHLLGAPGAETPGEEPREDKFIVQANAEIFLPPYLQPAMLYRLLTLTEMPAKGAAGNTVSLTRDSIRRALDSGETTRELLAFLQAHARTGIPQNVEYLINEVGGRHGHIHIGQAQMYIQVDTPLLLKELQARRELKDYFVRALSDTVAILSAEDPDKLLRELRKAGYLPVSDDAPKRRAVPEKARHAPPIGEPVVKPSKKVPVEIALDWERIAREDGKAWKDTPETPASRLAPPRNAIYDRAGIKRLLREAADEGECLEIAYVSQDGSGVRRRTIEPNNLMGNFLNAYCRDSGEDTTLNIHHIQWARPTGEYFES